MNLYIIKYATEDGEDYEWYWAESENKAKEQWGEFIADMGWEADLVNVYKVEYPKGYKLIKED